MDILRLLQEIIECEEKLIIAVLDISKDELMTNEYYGDVYKDVKRLKSLLNKLWNYVLEQDYVTISIHRSISVYERKLDLSARMCCVWSSSFTIG